MKRFVLLLAFLVFGVVASNAQNVAVKSNLLYDATQTINLGVEVGLHQRWTLDLSGNYNSWSKDSSVKWRHLFIQPEARYWFCDRFAGHFIGGHLIYGAFNFGNLNNNISFLGTDLTSLSKYRYQGFGYGIGLSYGYAFLLSKHLNLGNGAGCGIYFCRLPKV